MITVEVNERAFKRIERILLDMPATASRAAHNKGIGEAAKIVQQRAKETAPRGDRSKQSRKARERWDKRPLRQLIRVKKLKWTTKRNRATALIGGLYPYANQIFFIHPWKKENRKHVMWGRHAGVYRKENDFLKRALDDTRRQQFSAFRRAFFGELRRQLGKEIKRGGP